MNTVNTKKPHLTESVEDYLESILFLSTKLEYVRSVDVASHLGYSKPSVSHAVKLLQEEGLITVTPDKHLKLTAQGRKAADETYSRHVFFTEMLESLGVSKDVAEEDACRIEHVISKETFEALKRFYHSASAQTEQNSQPAEAA